MFKRLIKNNKIAIKPAIIYLSNTTASFAYFQANKTPTSITFNLRTQYDVSLAFIGDAYKKITKPLSENHNTPIVLILCNDLLLYTRYKLVSGLTFNEFKSLKIQQDDNSSSIKLCCDYMKLHEDKIYQYFACFEAKKHIIDDFTTILTQENSILRIVIPELVVIINQQMSMIKRKQNDYFIVIDMLPNMYLVKVSNHRLIDLHCSHFPQLKSISAKNSAVCEWLINLINPSKKIILYYQNDQLTPFLQSCPLSVCQIFKINENKPIVSTSQSEIGSNVMQWMRMNYDLYQSP